MKKQSLKKNIIYSMSFQILKIITPLITAPYISRVLGASNIGIYSYTYSIAMYFTLFGGLGTVSYGTREIARCRDHKQELSQNFFEIEMVSIITTTISLIAWGIFTALNTQYRAYYLVLTFNLLAVMFDISWFYAGIEHFKYTVLWNSIARITSVVCLLLFVKTANDLLVYIFIMSFTTLAANITMWIYLPKFIHRIKLRSMRLKHHFRETLVYFIPTIATSVYNVLDKTLIGVITKDTYENGYYEQANKILDICKTVTFVAINSVLSSRISYLFAEKKFEEIKQRIHLSMDFVLFMGIGICFGLIGIAENFVPWFFGDGYHKVIGLLQLMSPVVLIIGISNCLGSQYYTPSGRRRESARYIIAGAVINFCLNCAFIPFLKAYGAAIATIIAELAITFLYIKNARQYMSFSVIFTLGWKKIIAACFMLALTLSVGRAGSGFLIIFLQVSLGFSTYVIIQLLLRDHFILDIYHIIMKNRSTLLKR